MRILTTVLIGGAAAGLMLTGCSSSSSTSSSSASPTESAAASPGTTPGKVLPPIEITAAGKKSVKVGDTLNVTAPGVTKVKTNNPEVLEVTQAYSDGSAQFNAGAKVIAPGKARLVVIGDNGKFVVGVTATE